MTSQEPYRLSFTTGGLLLRESVIATPLFAGAASPSAVREMLMQENGLQQRTEQSKRTVSREVVARLACLEEEERLLLTEATAAERAHLMWVATCRRYALIAEFAEEVVREKFLLMTPALTLADFDAFFRGRSLWHDELNSLASSTVTKLRQNLFRMLREAELLSADGHILHILPSSRLVHALGERGIEDFHRFPMSDAEIERVTR